MKDRASRGCGLGVHSPEHIHSHPGQSVAPPCLAGRATEVVNIPHALQVQEATASRLADSAESESGALHTACPTPAPERLGAGPEGRMSTCITSFWS